MGILKWRLLLPVILVGKVQSFVFFERTSTCFQHCREAGLTDDFRITLNKLMVSEMSPHLEAGQNARGLKQGKPISLPLVDSFRWQY